MARILRRIASAAALLVLLAVLVCLMLARKTGTELIHTVVWMQDDQIIAEQHLLHGMKLQSVTPDAPGRRFLGWLDETGAPVSPADQPAQRSAVYTAQLTPAPADGHPAFLFADRHGLLYPDDPFTGAALDAALTALCAPDAVYTLPGLGADAPMTQLQLIEALDGWFDVTALSALRETADAQASVTRAEAAALLCTLLDRSPQQMQTLPYVPDLPPEHPHAAVLAEAAFDHTPDPEGAACRPEPAEAAEPLTPGFLLLDRQLYYVQPDGYILRSGDVGTLHFGPDGRYTSGNETLDGYVRDILATLDPDGTMPREQLLEAAYDHVVHGYSYLRVHYYDFGETGWEIEEALGMFERGRGNCYCYAAAFWSLARALGYEARAISGTMTETYQPHGWVEIDFDGQTYVFDTETEYAYYRDGRTPQRLFMRTYPSVTGWHYRRA